MEKLRRLVIAALTGLTLAAVVRELRLPASSRTWQGRIAGFPYDFRPPTLERVRRRWWNPEDPRLLTERAFGLGWAVNLARLAGRTSAPARR